MRTRSIMAAVALVSSTALLVSAPAQAEDPVNPYEASYVTESYEEGSTPPVKANKTAGGTEAKVGTCSGSSKTAWRTQKINNTYGTTLAYIKLSTTWFYNGKVVTCAYSSRNAYVTTYGALGGWEFKGWTDFGEQFYAYNGRTNGGVKTWTSGWFKGCNNVAGVSLCSTGTTTARTYVHYDGTYSTGGATG